MNTTEWNIKGWPITTCHNVDVSLRHYSTWKRKSGTQYKAAFNSIIFENWVSGQVSKINENLETSTENHMGQSEESETGRARISDVRLCILEMRRNTHTHTHTHPNWHFKFLIKKQFWFIEFTYKLWLRFTLKQMCLIPLHTTKLV